MSAGAGDGERKAGTQVAWSVGLVLATLLTVVLGLHTDHGYSYAQATRLLARMLLEGAVTLGFLAGSFLVILWAVRLLGKALRARRW